MQYVFILLLICILQSCLPPQNEINTDFLFHQAVKEAFSEESSAQQSTSFIQESQIDLGKEGTTFKLDDLISAVLKANPKLKAAESHWVSKVSKIKQVTSLDDPMLMLGLKESEDFPLNVPDIMMRELSVSQMFPWPGKLELEGEIARNEARAAYQEYLSMRLELEQMAKELYYELAFVKKAIDDTKEIKKLLEDLEKVAQLKYAAGKVAQVDTLKAQVEISELDSEIAELEQMRQLAKARINNLLNRPQNSPLGDPEGIDFVELDLDVDKLFEVAYNNKPEIRVIDFEIEAMKKEFDRAKLEFYPDFTIGLGVVNKEEMELKMKGNMLSMREVDNTYWDFALSINLPVRIEKRKSKLQQVAAMLQKLNFEKLGVLSNILYEIKDGVIRYNTAKYQANLYKTSIIPTAEQSLKSSNVEYQADKAEFLDLLDAQRSLLKAKIALNRIISDAWIAISKIEKAVGKNIIEKK